MAAAAPAPALASSYGNFPTAPQGTAGYGNVDGPPSPQMIAQYGAPSAAYPTGGGPIPAPVPPVAAAPGAGAPTVASVMTPAMQQYINAFNSSIGQQQAAINSGMIAAMQGLGSRRAAAANVAAALPDQYRQAYDAATKNATYAAQQAGFGHPTIGASADAPLIAAANAQQQAAGLAAQPLLQAGIQADYSQGQTALANTEMQNQADIAAQKAGFNQDLLKTQMQLQAQNAQQQNTFANDVAMAGYQSQLGLANWRAENPNAALTPAQQEQQQNTSQLDQQAIKAGFTDYADMQNTMNLPDYRNAVAILANGTHGLTLGGQSGIQDNKTSVIKALASQPKVLDALLYNGVISATDRTAAGV